MYVYMKQLKGGAMIDRDYPIVIDMSPQAMFNHVYTHLWWQNRQATGEDRFCAYRGKGGTMCAIGCLIPDDKYTYRLEKLSVGDLENYGLLDFEGGLALAIPLQRAHDLYDGEDAIGNIVSFRGWLNSKFTQIAERFNLHFEPLDEVLHATKTGI